MLARFLDHDSVPQLIDNLLSVRTNISRFLSAPAFRQHPIKRWRSRQQRPGGGGITDAFAELTAIFSVVWRLPPQPDLRSDPQRHEGVVYSASAATSFSPKRAAWRSVSIISWRKQCEPARMTRFTSWFVATAMTAARSGTGWNRRPDLAANRRCGLFAIDMVRTRGPPAPFVILLALHAIVNASGRVPAAVQQIMPPSAFCRSSSTSNPTDDAHARHFATCPAGRGCAAHSARSAIGRRAGQRSTPDVRPGISLMPRSRESLQDPHNFRRERLDILCIIVVIVVEHGKEAEIAHDLRRQELTG